MPSNTPTFQHRTRHEPYEPRRRPPSSQVGVYLLLLAMSATGVMRQTSNALVPHADGLGDGFSAFDFGTHMPELEHLAATMELREQLTEPAAERARRAVTCAEEDDAEDDGVTKTVAEDEESGEYDEDAMEIADDSDVMEVPIPGSFATALSSSSDVVNRIEDLEMSVIATILQFLPIHDLSRVRVATRTFATAASWIAPRPFSDSGVTFVRCGWLSTLPDPVPRPRAPPVPFHWRCLNCGEYSSFHELCTVCGCNVRQSAARVFIGQLRKRHSALALQHMINLLCPQVKVLHIESHSNREGYEKGAAWLYVDQPEHAFALLALHKRVFFDADESGDEGFWFIEDDGASALVEDARKTQLFEFATQRKADETRKRMCLPGQPLVVELPQTSMLTGHQPVSLHTTANVERGPTVRRDHLGWYHTANM